jgi:hypothetical protein
MWIVYFALAVALLALAILAFLLARRRLSVQRDAYSSGDYVTIASVFVNVATLLVALVALYVAFQSLNQPRGPATEPAAAIQPQPLAKGMARSAASTPQSGASAAPAPGEPNGAAAAPAAGRPDVRVEFEMSAKALGAFLVNESASQAATEIGCEARLWDLDDPDDDSFQDPIATPCGTSYLNPRAVLGPTRLVEGPSNQPRVIENSDRFFGYVIVGCPLCLATRAYAVYFVLGTNQGWTAPRTGRYGAARAEPANASAAAFTRETAEAAAAQFLARGDKQPIRAVGRL